MNLHRLLELDAAERRCVCLCGAGGKTTLLFALAREAAAAGERAAVVTTTHIFRPEAPDLAVFDGGLDAALCRKAWEAGKVVVAGRLTTEGKLSRPGDEDTALLREAATALYVEADGSKRLPMKFPAAYEPVLLPETRRVVVVTGLSALGRPLDEVCHRAGLARERLGDVGQIVDEMLLARIIATGYSHLQPTVALNQSDLPGMKERGRLVAGLLQAAGISRVHVVSWREILAGGLRRP